MAMLNAIKYTLYLSNLIGYKIRFVKIETLHESFLPNLSYFECE